MEEKRQIVVSGDICMNLLQWRQSRLTEQTYSYENYPEFHTQYYEGGALLLGRLIEYATGTSVRMPYLERDRCSLEKDTLVSVVHVKGYKGVPLTDRTHEVYRVERFLGYETLTSQGPTNFAVEDDVPDPCLLVLDDANNGFNQAMDQWPMALKEKSNETIVLYKSNRLNFENPLWQQIKSWYLDQTVVIISAEDLRAKGVNISRGLSWEKTGMDFIWQLKNNPVLDPFHSLSHVIIPLGLEGAIYFSNTDKEDISKLYFLTYEFEGGMIREEYGQMYGLTSCFVAGLVRAIFNKKDREQLKDQINEGIREGMAAAQKYYAYGFGEKITDCSFPNPNVFQEEEDDFILKSHIQDIVIKNTSRIGCKGCWYIIKEKNTANLAEIAFDIVKHGERSALKYIPIARFGRLKTVDRTEIEAYRSIKRLIEEYISNAHTIRPLSIAVFGTPGSGKSFGVTEVASSIAPKLVEKLDFNLSQFQSVSDLIAAFHKVRDVSLMGRLPLVFFDEFDSAFNGKLGWLKYFLAPMQDGTFREGDLNHPIGKAIFVFAGGTSVTYEAFCGEDRDSHDQFPKFYEQFQDAKGPDFVSRLRGYVNIMGINPVEVEGDALYIIRRAMLLRVLLEMKAPHLLTVSGEAMVDDGIIRAMLHVPRYKHESRSMEAIIEMSMLSHAKKWEQSHLPSAEQLKLHVDEERFYEYLMQEGFLSEIFRENRNMCRCETLQKKKEQ